ncbi:hypothetical protein D3C84_1063740 [compost metagenome]
MLAIASISLFLDISTLNNFNDWKIELFGKLPVALIVTWNRHNCACTVPTKHIIRDPNWHFRVIHWIDGISTCEHT